MQREAESLRGLGAKQSVRDIENTVLNSRQPNTYHNLVSTLRNAELISTANPMKGQSSVPRDLPEQIIFENVQRNPEQGMRLKGMNGDTRFSKANGFQKMQITDKLFNDEIITVHYQYNFISKRAYDIKFVTRKRNYINPHEPFNYIKNSIKR